MQGIVEIDDDDEIDSFVPQVSPEAFFSEDYIACRERFIEAGIKAGATLHCLEIGLRGPQGENLCTDIAWLGPAQPKRLLLHISGTHGIEGFAGAAIQLRLLESFQSPLPEDTACVFVHSVNPYGQAWLRRCNEENVDLNRNWVEERPFVSPLYHELQYFLNPRSPPGDFNWLNKLIFYLQGIFFILSYGYEALKQAIAEGQYLYPRGLFFGGHRLQRGAELLTGFLQPRLARVEIFAGVDVHTGLGAWSEDSLLCPMDKTGESYAFLKTLLGERIQPMHVEEGVAYAAHGELLPGIARRVDSAVRRFLIVQEFGAYSDLETLYALRQENRFHYYGRFRSQTEYLEHASKLCLKEVFCPAESSWRRQVVLRGEAVFYQMMKAIRV